MEPIMPRTDIQPVVLGGDWSSYSIAREFEEAFGTPTYCVAPGGIAVIEKSRFMRVKQVRNTGPEEVLRALREIAAAHPDRTIVLMANTDDRVASIEQVRDDLPDSVRFRLPSRMASRLVSDKVKFAELCESHGLDTPRTEIVSLAGEGRIAPTKIDFPLVAKPAVSADYVYLYPHGFQKVYFVHEQAELDKLWSDLREYGFAGDFLVQELIPGDDTMMDSITMYADSQSRITLRAAAHVLLEDHVPALLGNPVAMITTPMPDLWERLGSLLTDISWTGFANVDIKRDPRDGRRVFLDCNPRIGSNSYYVCAGGVNPMYVLVRDVVDGVSEPAQVDRSVLYHRVPKRFVRRYLSDDDLLAQYDELVRSGDCYNPTRCPHDTAASRFWGMVMESSYVRKFNKYYPKPTETSF